MRFLLGLVISGAIVFGQTVSGILTGSVKDPQGAAVVGATAVARNIETGAQASVRTDELGSYRLANLTPGSYQIDFTAAGFRKMTATAGVLGAGEIIRQDATLEVGQVTESVTVEGTATHVNTDDGQLSQTVREIPRLPLLSGTGGRSPLALALIIPGVGTNIATSQQGNFSVNGQRFYSNSFQLDGGDAYNQVGGWADAAVNNISLNALAEFRLVSGAMKAEFGRNSGSAVIATTRSGGNRWHGGASETFRNTKLNAVPFFQNAIAGGTSRELPNGSPRNPQWNSNDFDANLGGPIRRDKTFFFASYLGYRQRVGSRNTAVVPSDSQRAAIESAGVAEAKALLALIPRASYGNTLISAPVWSISRNQGLAKLDHTFSQANRFSATYFIEDWLAVNPFSNSPVPGFGVTNTNRWQSLVLRDTHAFSPALFHDFRATFHRSSSDSLAPLNRTPLSSLGLGKIVPDNPSSEGPPWISISGFSAFGNTFNGPQAYKINGFQYLDNLSWTRGRHNWKLGGDFRTFAMNTSFDNSPNGSITIDGSGTTVNPRVVARLIPGLTPALNDFANGFATTFSQTSSARVAHRQRAVNLFVQDDWKIRPGLSLNLGLRWEFNGPYTDVRDRVVGFRPGQQSSVFPDAPVGMVYPGDTGVPRSTYANDYNNLAPRFGFAWDVLKNGRLSLRGGYGLFYDAPFQEILMGASLFSPPFSIRPSTTFTDYANPWAGSRVNPLSQPFPNTPAKAGDRVDFKRFAPVGFTFLDPSFRTPYGQQWNLQVQYQFYKDWLLEAGYVGSNGVKLSNERQYNHAVAGPGATAGNTNQRRILNLGNPQNAQFGGATFGSVVVHTGNANSNYHAMQLQATRRLARGFQMSHAYTWSHNIDNASGRRVSSRFDPRQDRGNSDMDVRHRYVLTFVYELPFRGRLLGGWGVSGLTRFQSGLWLSVLDSQDRCLCATGNQRADSLGTAIQYIDPRSTTSVADRPNSWFDGAGSGTPAGTGNPYFRRVGSAPTFESGAGRYGNAGRNTIQAPGLNNWNLAAFKRTPVREGHDVELRAELFNAFNHTQFGFPNTNIDSPNFGRITATNDPRIVQFSLRYRF